MAVALLGDEAAAERAPLARAHVADRDAVEADRLRLAGGDLAGQRVHQLVLAVAGDAGDAEDLARRDGEAHFLQIGAERIGRGDRQPVDDEARRRGAVDDAPAARLRLEFGGDHQLGELLGRFLARRAMGDDAAEAHDRRGVAERADLLELVADVEDRAAFGGEAAQRHEQRLGLLRRQHRGRLVHDQQLRLLQQAAHDLDALALADREVVHRAVGVERQAVFARGLGDALAQVGAFARAR